MRIEEGKLAFERRHDELIAGLDRIADALEAIARSLARDP